MGRLLTSFALLYFCAALAACSKHATSVEANYLHDCAKIGGTNADGFLCYADSVSIVSFPEKYCDKRVVTFGYASRSWAGLRLYSDQARAAHQIVTSSILFDDPDAAKAVDAEIQQHSKGGVYLTLTATFECSNSKRAEDELGVGRFADVSRIGVVDFDGGSQFVRERIIGGAEAHNYEAVD